jgi:hypothetical protein
MSRATARACKAGPSKQMSAPTVIGAIRLSKEDSGSRSVRSRWLDLVVPWNRRPGNDWRIAPCRPAARGRPGRSYATVIAAAALGPGELGAFRRRWRRKLRESPRPAPAERAVGGGQVRSESRCRSVWRRRRMPSSQRRRPGQSPLRSRSTTSECVPCDDLLFSGTVDRGSRLSSRLTFVSLRCRLQIAPESGARKHGIVAVREDTVDHPDGSTRTGADLLHEINNAVHIHRCHVTRAPTRRAANRAMTVTVEALS